MTKWGCCFSTKHVQIKKEEISVGLSAICATIIFVLHLFYRFFAGLHF